jgi:hypothetical protein
VLIPPPPTGASDPRKAAMQINSEIAAALAFVRARA